MDIGNYELIANYWALKLWIDHSVQFDANNDNNEEEIGKNKITIAMA